MVSISPRRQRHGLGLRRRRPIWIKVSGWQGSANWTDDECREELVRGLHRQLVAAAVQKCDGVYSRVLKFNEAIIPERAGESTGGQVPPNPKGCSDPVLEAQAVTGIAAVEKLIPEARRKARLNSWNGMATMVMKSMKTSQNRSMTGNEIDSDVQSAVMTNG